MSDPEYNAARRAEGLRAVAQGLNINLDLEVAIVCLNHAADKIERLERERDEWKAKYIQQNKDLRCEMMDPNGTIWDHAKKLQDENKALQEKLDAALMLGKMQERRHERELAEARGESFQVQAWKQLTEQHRNEMRGL